MAFAITGDPEYDYAKYHSIVQGHKPPPR